MYSNKPCSSTNFVCIISIPHSIPCFISYSYFPAFTVTGIATFHSNLTFIGNTTFLENHATFGSAGIYMINCSLSSTGSIHFINNSFTDPDFSKNSGVAIWASASSLNISGTTNFVGNRNVVTNNSAGFCCCDVIYASHNTSLSFSGTSNFTYNSVDLGSTIHASDHTSLSFTGTSNFINNSAHYGGGVLLWKTTFSISSNTTVHWEKNHAWFGGAICVMDNAPLVYCTQLETCTTKYGCFFQLPGQNLSNGIDTQFVFRDNSAEVAGSVLYGGAIDHCKVTGQESYSSGEVFDMLVHIDNGSRVLVYALNHFAYAHVKTTTLTVVNQTRITQCILVKHFRFLWLQLDKEMEQFLQQSEAV